MRQAAKQTAAGRRPDGAATAVPHSRQTGSRNAGSRRQKRAAAHRGSHLLPSEPGIELAPPQSISYGLLMVTVILICFGLVMLFSTSIGKSMSEQGYGWYYILRQSVLLLPGLAALGAFIFIDVRRFNRPGILLLLYLFCTVLLALIFTPLGVEVNGQRRWLKITSSINWQPSELIKLAVVFCGAGWYSWLQGARRRGFLRQLKGAKKRWANFAFDFVIPFSAVTVWCVLIAMQSHMSAVLIIYLLLLAVFLSAGISRDSWRIALGLLLGLAGLLLILFLLMHEQQQLKAWLIKNPRLDHLVQRFNIFFNTGEASEADSYQSQQALTAIGSGGWTGLGLGQSRLKNNYLPEMHTDYIYAIICEELGLIGGVTVVLLFLLYFGLGVGIAFKTHGVFARILAFGYAVFLPLQAFLSMAVNLKVFFPTGISLPFFSYGGTSNIFFLTSCGILLSLSKFAIRSPFATIRKDEKRETAASDRSGLSVRAENGDSQRRSRGPEERHE
ncbi:FtsW/RodA/SpoVE family cell cycle protein [Oscillospiraceae bacterium HV4-5-C5C]|nr:FtsW/RodA/SpoVE family cell cycle protein [Oscillospiraceae bacterium HV4-5-C5C]